MLDSDEFRTPDGDLNVRANQFPADRIAPRLMVAPKWGVAMKTKRPTRGILDRSVSSALLRIDSRRRRSSVASASFATRPPRLWPTRITRSNVESCTPGSIRRLVASKDSARLDPDCSMDCRLSY